jgi:hypothetical protein
MRHEPISHSLLLKQNILKNITVLAFSFVFGLWIFPYLKGLESTALDIFTLLGIFPLGAMFAYFAFRYSDTNMDNISHRILADISTFLFLTIICISIIFATMLAVIGVPQLKKPFIVLAILLISGCIFYDFWNLYTKLNVNKSTDKSKKLCNF